MPTITIRKEVARHELREMLYEQILEHGPEHFNQRAWVTVNGDVQPLNRAPSVDLNACGTTACLAGHASVLGAKVNLVVNDLSDTTTLADAYGVDRSAFDYLPTQWPDAMRVAYGESKKVNPSEQDAEWWGALQYLISLRGRKD